MYEPSFLGFDIAIGCSLQMLAHSKRMVCNSKGETVVSPSERESNFFTTQILRSAFPYLQSESAGDTSKQKLLMLPNVCNASPIVNHQFSNFPLASSS